MRLTFSLESVNEVGPEVLELGRLHWLETENYRHDQPYNPDLDRYSYYESVGFYRLYIARAADRIVGNLGMYVTESMHTQQLIATEDTLFLHPDFRTGRNAAEFIRFMVDDMRARGVVEIMCTAKNPRVSRLLEFLDFKAVATQHSLRVGAYSAVSSTAVTGSADASNLPSGPAV